MASFWLHNEICPIYNITGDYNDWKLSIRIYSFFPCKQERLLKLLKIMFNNRLAISEYCFDIKEILSYITKTDYNKDYFKSLFDVYFNENMLERNIALLRKELEKWHEL